MTRRNKFAGGSTPAANTNGGFGGRGGHNQGPQRASPFAGTKPFAKQPNGLVTGTTTKFQRGGKGKQPERQGRYQPPPGRQGKSKVAGGEPTERTKQLSPFAFTYANKLLDHLKKENISPPQWPAEPGNPDKRGAIESLKDSFKKYRTRVYATLRKADLIDDPEKRRKLEDALPFKGICEDMCPEFEKVYRIAEYDVKTEEKEASPDGLSMWPDPSRMVKKFGRSAAGQDAPLPMDVRSVDALRRTTDYLFNDLLQSESNLPSMHNFLWDRTRAVRKDFTFHSQKSPEEMKDMVYCFETITRFHATALHLLSRKGFALESFDQKQEIEQLGRTILSLIEAYDECRDKRVLCENEPEFRAYYLLLNAHDPSIARRIPTWGKEYWFESEEVQTALSLIQAMDDVREPKGPIKPRRPTTLSDTAFTNYFSIVEDSRVSYTMACIAEIHFTTVRQGILRNLVRGYARHRDAPRTITASDLNAMLRFDTPEEAVEFAELHDFEFSSWVPEGKNAVAEPYLLLNNKKKHVPSPRVRQSFSGKVVERKRTTQSLPHVIYNTVFEEAAEKPLGAEIPSAEDSPDGMFVAQAAASKDLSSMGSPTVVPPVKPSIPSATTPSPFAAATTTSPFASAIPATGALGGTPAQAAAPSFPGFQASQPTASAASSPFAALSQPTPQAQAGKSPFSFLNRPPASSTTDAASKPPSVLGQSAQIGQTTAAPLKPPESSKPFTSFQGFGSTAAPLAQTTQAPQPSSTLPSAPSLLGSTAPKPAAPCTLAQEAASAQTKLGQTGPLAAVSGSAPFAGTSPFSTNTLAPPAAPQATTAAHAVPSIFVSPPVTTAPAASSAPSTFTNALSNVLGTSASGSATTVGGPATKPPAPPPPPPAPKRDLIGDVANWYVKGDTGLMEDFTESILAEILWGVWQKFERDEAERKRKEEDEESWRLARAHQQYRLQVKYFYRWRNTARSLATKRILREGKEKMRLYREQQKAIQKQQQEEKEKAEREARRAARRQLMEDTHRLSMLASSSIHHRRGSASGSVAYSADHNHHEEQLLASGIFHGMRDDPRAVARRVVREAAAAATLANGADNSWASRSFRYPESELDLELEPAQSSRDYSPDTASSAGGGRREGWKTRSLRERFGIEPRRSLSASGSGSVLVNGGDGGSFLSGSLSSSVGRFRQSLPGRSTNFSSRKRSAEEEGEGGSAGSVKVNGVGRSRHWDLRARPEAIARVPAMGYNPDSKTKGKGKETGYDLAGDYSLDFASPDVDHHHQHQDDHQQHEPDLLPDNDDASETSRPGASSPTPTPSDWRLRLARLKKSAAGRPGHGHHRAQGSMDLGLSLLGDASPPHPPFAASGMLPPRDRRSGSAGMTTGAGKRKRGVEVDGDEDELMGEGEGYGSGDREVSPLVRKRANLEGASASASGAAAGAGVGGGVVVPGREETSVMVANTRRMLRELREAMDRADGNGNEDGSVRGEVYLGD
jgi:hypothetical protein